jgi:hypothetical protein
MGSATVVSRCKKHAVIRLGVLLTLRRMNCLQNFGSFLFPTMTLTLFFFFLSI